MSSLELAVTGVNWGALAITDAISEDNSTGKDLLLSTVKGNEKVTNEDDNDEESNGFVGANAILRIPLNKVSTATGARNDVSLVMKPSASRSGIILTKARFSVPSMCIGFDNPDGDACKLIGKRLQGILSQTGTTTMAHVMKNDLIAASQAPNASPKSGSGLFIASFNALPLVSPQSTVDIIVTTTKVLLTDSKKGLSFSFNRDTVERLFLLKEASNVGSSLFVVSFSRIVQIGSQSLSCLALRISSELSFEAEPLPLPRLPTEETIVAAGLSKDLLSPGSMSGDYVSVFSRVMKAALDRPLSGNLNEDDSRFIEASYRSTDGYLYPLKTHLLFLPRPGLAVPLASIVHIHYEMAGLKTIYGLTVFLKESSSVPLLALKTQEKKLFPNAKGRIMLIGIAKTNLTYLIDYFSKKEIPITEVKSGGGNDEDDDDDDDDESDDDSDDETDVDTDEFESDSDYSSVGSDDSNDKKRGKNKKSKDKKEKNKDKKEKKDKKHKKDKKEKKEKEKKEKKDKDRDRKRERE